MDAPLCTERAITLPASALNLQTATEAQLCAPLENVDKRIAVVLLSESFVGKK
jgi:hypothetical protein